MRHETALTVSLRLRLALTFGGLASLIVLGLVVVTSVSSGSDLQSAVDRQLATRAELFGALASDDRDQLLDIVYTSPSDPQIDAQLDDLAFRFQFIDSTGASTGASDVPVDVGVITDVLRTGEDSYRTIDVGDRQLRVLTTASETGVIQVATDVTALEDGLTRLRRTVIGAGMIGSIIAIAVGLVAAIRIVKPLNEVTEAARRLTPGSDLPAPVEARRRDEIGDLARGFNGMLDKLALSQAQQERLVADASHELRTPLTSLRLKLEFLASEPDLADEQRRRIVDAAAVELETLTELTSEVTELAAMSRRSENVQPVGLGDLIDDVARRARITTGRIIDISTSDTRVGARPSMVRRAVSNLIVNAHKYSPDDKPIEITESGGRIEVRDHGPGIDVSERDRVFDRFFRGRTTHDIGGTGIGLAIVRHVAELHDGEVWIDDHPSGGAIVGFSLRNSGG